VLQKLFGYAILLVTLLWLILSYIPGSVMALPQISYSLEGSGRLFQVLLVGGFLIFGLLQVWLVYATKQIFRTADGDENKMTAEFGLNRSSEMFWTAVPLLMTIGLALASYQTWSMLTPVK
jgi:heme/copper-type cytochrome/quinol oxidase subunit 2